MAANVPADFKQFQVYLQASQTIQSKSPAASAVMKIAFYQACQDYSEENQLSPEASNFLQSFGPTVPPLPANGVEETQKLADTFYTTLTDQFQSGNLRIAMVQQFKLCSLLYEVLDGDENENRCKTCKAVAVKIKKMLDKGLQGGAKAEGNTAGNAPSFTPTNQPPVFSPVSGGPPPSFTPTSGGPPVFTPSGSAGGAGGPPVFTPTNQPPSAGPPQFDAGPPQSSGGPPQFSAGPPQFSAGPPQSSGGPPQFGASPPQSSGGPPVFTPNAQPQQQGFQKPIDPSFDVQGAKNTLSSLGYGIVDPGKYPPLDQITCSTIECYLDYAVKRVQAADKVQALGFLKDALKTWSSGKPQ
ncbi:hypothetical protein TRFO_28886 [Tritrichomonas foetus]|uniref:Uncharacterized protein n=1 Tax=Tritrichomonas foetus TaxID=1144522 RepID=A0A1J4K1L9_9EUKA|nr:hypothetical protein TRFO_28886 [Tritrichomonas foetus]|eukprot:OHT03636.1 hypothetical protein TRFO_28886 [Tritrichomonas foetus]